ARVETSARDVPESSCLLPNVVLLRAVFNFPGVVEHVPGLAADKVAARPALAAARALLWHLAAHRCGERLEHRLAAELGIFFGLFVTLVLESAEIATLAIEHVLDDVLELAATTASAFAQLSAARGPGGAIERVP